ncbi:MAG: CDP-glycerol glycerophosphotransferase family protein, partial [Gammaproteobacteria bacterium]
MFKTGILYTGYALLFAGRFVMLPLYFLSGLMPRRKNLWVFGSWGGHRFADNAAGYFLYCQQHATGVDLVWISRERDIVARLRAAGFQAHCHWSLAGAWACLRAGTHYFDCFGKDTNFWLSRGAATVCLWSGVPLKAFERDIDNPASRYYRLFHGSVIERVALAMMMPWHVRRPDRIIALSTETRDITARAFDVPPERVLITGYPRNDRLLKRVPATPGLQRELPWPMSDAIAAGRKVILYLPTFRDSGRPYARIDWPHLDALMERLGATFFYKFHPMDHSDLHQELSNVHEIPRDRDVYDFLGEVDVLISDYSSIIFDYLLLERPVVSYTPDLAEFLADCRALNFRPEEIATMPACKTYPELARRLETIIQDKETGDPARFNEICERLHRYRDGRASQRIFTALNQHPIGRTLGHGARGDETLPPAIVFGCQKPGWGIIRALGTAGIPVVAAYYDPKDPAYVSRYVSESMVCPHPEHAQDSFHAFARGLAARYPGAVLLPSNDYTLVALSSMGELPETARVAVPDAQIVARCIEKDHTYGLADSIGVRAPITRTVTTLDEALEQAETIGYPCLLKPAVGHRFFSVLRVKMFKVTSVDSLQAAWNRTAAIDGDMLIQEFIPGGDDHGVNYNALWDQGRPLTEVTAAKLRLSPRGIGFPTVVVNRYVPEIIEPARAMLAALNFHGFANVEFKRDARNGEYVLMEINPRLNQSLLLSVATGVNFAAMAYRQCLGQPIGADAISDPYRVRRYYIDTDRDIREALKELPSGQLSLKAFLTPYLSRQVSATFSW